MGNHADRQRHFCEPGTGRAYRNNCKPKLSLYEFIASDRDSIYESKYLYNKQLHGRDDAAIGTDANFMFEWLKPNADSSLDDVKEFLLERFALIGDTANLEPFLAQLASLHGWSPETSRRRIEGMQRNHTNQGTP